MKPVGETHRLRSGRWATWVWKSTREKGNGRQSFDVFAGPSYPEVTGQVKKAYPDIRISPLCDDCRKALQEAH